MGVTSPPISPGGPEPAWLAAFLLPQGRIGRGEFWLGLVIHWQVLRLLGVGQWIAAARHGLAPAETSWLQIALSALDLWLVFVHCARRAHDVGFSARWVFLAWMPIVGWLFAFVVLGCWRGSRAANRWGPPPGQAPVPIDATAEPATPVVITAPPPPPPVRTRSEPPRARPAVVLTAARPPAVVRRRGR